MFGAANVWQSSVLLFFLTTPVFAAVEESNWDLAYSQGVAALDDGRYGDAVQQLSAALDLARNSGPEDVRLMKSLYALGLAYQTQGDPASAEPLYMEAKAAIEAGGPPSRPLLGYVYQGLGQLRFDQGRWKEAESLLRQSMAVCIVHAGPLHPCTLSAERHLAEVLAAEGSTTEAETHFENLISTLRRLPSERPDFLVGTLANYGALFVHEERFDRAAPLLQESLSLASQSGIPAPVLGDTLVSLGEMYRLEHSYARAEPLLRKALNIYETANDPHQAGALNELGLVALDEQKFAIAKNYIKQSLHIYEKAIGPAHVMTARVKAALAEAFLGERDIAQARSLIGEALNIERRILGEKHSDYARLLMIAGNVEQAGRRRADADRFYRQALEVYRESLDVHSPERAGAEQSYARFAKSLHGSNSAGARQYPIDSLAEDLTAREQAHH